MQSMSARAGASHAYGAVPTSESRSPSQVENGRGGDDEKSGKKAYPYGIGPGGLFPTTLTGKSRAAEAALLIEVVFWVCGWGLVDCAVTVCAATLPNVVLGSALSPWTIYLKMFLYAALVLCCLNIYLWTNGLPLDLSIKDRRVATFVINVTLLAAVWGTVDSFVELLAGSGAPVALAKWYVLVLLFLGLGPAYLHERYTGSTVIRDDLGKGGDI